MTLAVNGMGPAELETAAVSPVEEALAALPAVRGLSATIDDGRAELVVELTDAAAISAVGDALLSRDLVERLPVELDPPFVQRVGPDAPALAVTVRDPEAEERLVRALEATAGVAAVTRCGGGDPVVEIAVDPARMAAMQLPVERLLAPLRMRTIAGAIGEPPLAFAALADLPIEAATPGVKLRDVAEIRRTRAPRTCVAADASGPAILLTVAPQADADARAVADAARAAIADLKLPPGAIGHVLPDSGPGPAVVALELAVGRQLPELAQALAPCLGAIPSVRAWALTGERPIALVAPPWGPALARLHLALDAQPPAPPAAGSPPVAPTLESVREALSRCSGVHRAAVLAPLQHADHRLVLHIAGAELPALAELAREVERRLAPLPGITALVTRAPANEPALRLDLDREQLAARGLTLALVRDALALAAGPIDLGHLGDGDPLRVALSGAADPVQALSGLYATGPAGPVSLAGLARVTEDSELRPLLRVDRRRVAALELRLRRASDRDAVQGVIAGLQLPIGVFITLAGDRPLP